MKQRRRAWVCALLALSLASSIGMARAAEAAEDAGDDRLFTRGFGYVGAFAVTRTSTKLTLFSNELPLGARLDLNKDLGVRDSFTVPRATLGWRFKKRHLLSAGYYNLNRDGLVELDSEIELPIGPPLPVGVSLATEFTSEIAKIQYTYIFHRSPKVMLGFGAGLFGGGFQTFNESVTAPLPVLGFRLTYRLSPRWIALFASDWFLLNCNDEYKGVLTDTQFYFSHRFAAGVNLQQFNVEIVDDDLTWELEAGLVGFLAAVTFYF